MPETKFETTFCIPKAKPRPMAPEITVSAPSGMPSPARVSRAAATMNTIWIAFPIRMRIDGSTLGK